MGGAVNAGGEAADGDNTPVGRFGRDLESESLALFGRLPSADDGDRATLEDARVTPVEEDERVLGVLCEARRVSRARGNEDRDLVFLEFFEQDTGFRNRVAQADDGFDHGREDSQFFGESVAASGDGCGERPPTGDHAVIRRLINAGELQQGDVVRNFLVIHAEHSVLRRV